jgi:iron-sulfur cluster repair protein YtfE (RIC family)
MGGEDLMSDALKVLMDDHRKVERLFKQAGEGGNYDVTLQICQELNIHSTLEEEIIYPVLEDEVDPDLAAEAQEEHDQAKSLIEEIEGMEPGDPELRQAVRMLRNAVQHHVQEEESSVFPKMEAQLGIDRLKELGRDIYRRRQDLLPS